MVVRDLKPVTLSTSATVRSWSRSGGIASSFHSLECWTCRREALSAIQFPIHGNSCIGSLRRKLLNGWYAPSYIFSIRLSLNPSSRRTARSGEQTSELQSLLCISYAFSCCTKKHV